MASLTVDLICQLGFRRDLAIEVMSKLHSHSYRQFYEWMDERIDQATNQNYSSYFQAVGLDNCTSEILTLRLQNHPDHPPLPYWTERYLNDRMDELIGDWYKLRHIDF